MKKLYIGLIASGILIFGGTLYSKYVSPEVDMSKVGGHFIQTSRVYNEDSYDVKVIYGDEDKLKIRITFDNIKGTLETRRITAGLSDNNKFNTVERNMVEKFFNSKKTVKEVVNYKWDKKPHNIVIFKQGYKIMKSDNNKYVKEVYEKVSDKNLSGTIELKKMELNKDEQYPESSIFCGINGSGTVDFEILNVYK